MSVWPPQGTDVSIRPPRVPTLAKGPHLSGYSKGEHLVLGKSIAHDMKSGAEGAHFLGALLLTFSFDKHTLQADSEIWENFQSFPPLYQRVRVDTIQIKKKQPDLFKSRLQKLLDNTKAGIMYGEWNDNGRLL